jgi:hypothetical protein
MPIEGNFNAGIPTSVAPYVGPGDIVSGATAWWGLRAYSAATAGTKAINIRASGDNATADINTLTNGNLDVVTVSSFLTTHGGTAFLTKMYDQTGGGNDVAQATAANQPSLVLSGLGSLPIIDATGGVWLDAVTFPGPTAQQYTWSLVFLSVNDSAQHVVLGDASGESIGIYPAGSGGGFYASINNTNNIAATDGTWYAYQVLGNGVSGNINQNGTSHVDNYGASAWAAQAHYFNYSPANSILAGQMQGTEAGFWPSGFSTVQMSNMAANQQNYWGF